MAKMTPEQEAAYAVDFGVARRDLPQDAQLIYDRLVEQRAHAPEPVTWADPATASRIITVPRWAAAAGTVLVFVIGQGGAVVLLPYAFTHWQPGPQWPLAVRVFGVVLIAVAGISVITGFVRFATEGVGIPVPTEPNARRLTIGGPYRYVRNPLYLAIVLAITGQAMLLSRPVLLVYAAVMLAAFVAFVRWFEEPTLARRFGAEYDMYRSQVPGWWPRLPHRDSHVRRNPDA